MLFFSISIDNVVTWLIIACVTLGLNSGNCCPTNDGMILACCNNSSTRIPGEWYGLIFADEAGKRRMKELFVKIIYIALIKEIIFIMQL